MVTMIVGVVESYRRVRRADIWARGLGFQSQRLAGDGVASEVILMRARNCSPG
jgi:hypothetical protein